jgi:site-specific DNA-methyltransferase (adenine-specific)
MYCRNNACKQRAYRKRKQGHPLGVHASSRTCEWATPQDLFDRLHAQYGFTLDGCATAKNAKCPAYFTIVEDGLAQIWTGRVWMNPPYGREIRDWMRKAWEASQTTAEVVVCLVPARTDTAWWHEYAKHGAVDFLPGRLRFGGAEHPAPFPSAVVVFTNPNAGRSAFSNVTKSFALVG